MAPLENPEHIVCLKPRHERTGILSVRKQRRRSAMQYSVFVFRSTDSTNVKSLAFCGFTGRFVSGLVGNPKTGFLSSRIINIILVKSFNRSLTFYRYSSFKAALIFYIPKSHRISCYHEQTKRVLNCQERCLGFPK